MSGKNGSLEGAARFLDKLAEDALFEDRAGEKLPQTAAFALQHFFRVIGIYIIILIPVKLDLLCIDQHWSSDLDGDGLIRYYSLLITFIGLDIDFYR